MIVINKISGSLTGSLNNVYVTLNERGWNGSDNLFLKLVSKTSSNVNKIVTLGSDISTNPARFNVFQLIDSGSEDLSNSIVNFDELNYDYFIYSSPSASILDDSPLLEKGILRVKGLDTDLSYSVTQSINVYKFK